MGAAWANTHQQSVVMLKEQSARNTPLMRAGTEDRIRSAGDHLVQLNEVPLATSFPQHAALPQGGQHPYQGHDGDQVKVQAWAGTHKQSVEMLKEQCARRVPFARSCAESAI